MSTPAKVHCDRGDGRARCGRRNPVLAASSRDVDCLTCLNIMSGVHGLGNRQPDSRNAHGTAARYRWHLRHQGKPVRCEACLQAERRRSQDRKNLRRAA
jgi:hypothetical protein